MVDTGKEGQRLYSLLYNKYDDNYGGSVVGICGSQGSVKTSLCLDLAEKKMKYHKDEKIFWRETYDSPMQCRRLLRYKYRLYVEEKTNLIFHVNGEEIQPDIIYFKDIKELYDMAKPRILNVVFFSHIKKWTELIRHCNNISTDWNTVFLDEMEGLYKAGSNNQTDERWWDWMDISGEVIKECRKSHTSVVGNFHDQNLIDHRVNGKFMFHMYGFGAIVNRSRSRVTQTAVDQCRLGEFYIAQGRNRFGKICVDTFYPAVENNWSVKLNI